VAAGPGEVPSQDIHRPATPFAGRDFHYHAARRCTVLCLLARLVGEVPQRRRGSSRLADLLAGAGLATGRWCRLGYAVTYAGVGKTQLAAVLRAGQAAAGGSGAWGQPRMRLAWRRSGCGGWRRGFGGRRR